MLIIQHKRWGIKMSCVNPAALFLRQLDACNSCIGRSDRKQLITGSDDTGLKQEFCGGGIPLTGVIAITTAITTNGKMIPLFFTTSFSLEPIGLRGAEASSAWKAI